MPQPCLLMECESSPREEEIPPLFWGLDPVFLAFAKLYIKDILEMKESQQVPGTYFYNGHPIRRVDIMGAESSSDPAILSTARELSMTSQLKKLQETIEQKTRIGIGDIIRVRGSVRMFREEREICANIYYKVDDPVWNMQIARMLELPKLYQKVYDQPFRNPALQEEEALNNKDNLDLAGLTSLLSEKIKEFLQEKKMQSFYQQELETVESLQSLASRPVTHSTGSDQVELKDSGTSGVAQRVFKNALQLLQEKGLVFQRDSGSDKLYYVTTKDKDLQQKIYHIIKEDCQKPNHMAGLPITQNRMGENGVAGLITVSEFRGPVSIEGHPRAKAPPHLNWSRNSRLHRLKTSHSKLPHTSPPGSPDVSRARIGASSPTVIDVCLSFLGLQQ